MNRTGEPDLFAKQWVASAMGFKCSFFRRLSKRTGHDREWWFGHLHLVGFTGLTTLHLCSVFVHVVKRKRRFVECEEILWVRLPPWTR